MTGSALLAASLLLCCPHDQARQCDDQPPAVIRNITIQTNDVFDDCDGNLGCRFYGFANKLHFTTRPEIIRDELLFKAGSICNTRIIKETERNLRASPYLVDAKITTTPVGDNQVDVQVQTFDVWSTSPELGFSALGDQLVWRIGLTESNLFGAGQQLGFLHYSGIDRSSSGFSFADANIAGSRYSVATSHENRSDGYRSTLRFGRPFHSLASSWSFGFDFEGFDQLDPIYESGGRIADLHHISKRASFEYGRLVGRGKNSATRLHSRYWWTQDRIEDRLRQFGAVEFGISSIVDRHIKVSHVHKFEIPDDFNLGNEAFASVGLSTPALGGLAPNAWFFSLGESKGFQFGHENFALVKALWYARHQQGWKDSIAEVHFDYIRKLVPPRVFIAGVSFWYGHHLEPEIQFTLGADRGLRGYRVNQFAGDRALLLNLEKRWFIADQVAQLFSLAVGGFFDAGYAWPQGQSIDLGDLRPNAGLSLLVGRNRLSKSRPGFRVDLAYALRSVPDTSRWLVTVGTPIQF